MPPKPPREKTKGKTTLSIYEIEGDTLKICSVEPGKDRPTEFSSKPGSGHFLRVFKREKISRATALVSHLLRRSTTNGRK